MVIFGDSSPDSESPPSRRGKLFARSPSSSTGDAASRPPKHSLLHRSKASSHSRQSSFPFFGRRTVEFSDESIIAARQKVTDAEDAEQGADKALHAARMAVKEARQHVKNLEAEAAEEARRAKEKQAHTKNITKKAGKLGRHG